MDFRRENDDLSSALCGSQSFGSAPSLYGSQSFCGSSTGSFSSVSSARDPFTPTSGRSTPYQRPGSTDLQLSICTDGLGLDMTPPPSAGSGYFSMNGMETGSFDCMPDGLPVAPYGFTTPLEMPVRPVLGVMTPPGVLEMLPYDTFNPAVLMPTSQPEMWGQHQVDSPVDYFAIKPDPLPLLSGPMRRLQVEEVQQKGKLLQRQMLGSHRRAPRSRTAGLVSTTPKMMSESGIAIHVEKPPVFSCPFPGCGKKFRRAEHLKRHVQQ
jgi:hypothetical protein